MKNSLLEIYKSDKFKDQTAGYIDTDGSFIYTEEYHGEDNNEYKNLGLPEFSSTHWEEDTCVRIYKEPNEIQYKKLEEIIDYFLNTYYYCKVEIWDKPNKNYYFYNVYSLFEGACKDYTWNEKVGNWNGYKLVQIIKNNINKKNLKEELLLELNRMKKFLSNDRIFIDNDLKMDYFPQAVTYAMGTVKNNQKLDTYFKENRILEKRKNLIYEDAKNDIDCNTPLNDVKKIFNLTEMVARTKLNYIIYPRLDMEFNGIKVLEMSTLEKKELLEITNFTPNDTESLRKPWIRKRQIGEKEILINKRKLINKIMKEVKIKKIKYGVNTKAEEILKCLEEE